MNGSEFEALCRPLIEIITGKEFLLKGHTLEMKPLKGTVDLIQGDDFKVIGQCGTDKDYFNSNKPIKDIEGSIKNSPDFKTIYLFSNRKADGDDYQTTRNNISKKLRKELQSGYQYHLYDGPRIAKKIYDNIYQTIKIEEILHYLPGAYQYYLELPQTNNLPILPSYYEVRPEEEEIARRLTNVDFLQVYGLSGIGKSLLSLAVANNLSSEFDTILWFNGKDIDPAKLHSVNIQRMGEAINLASVLKMFKVLLIVDNFNTDVEGLQTSFLKYNQTGSKCIVTSLQKNIAAENSYALTYVPDVVSKRILLNSDMPPTEAQLDVLVKQIYGYPLLLELAKKAVEGGEMSWNDVISEANITEINDTQRNEIFAQRIIGRYVGILADMFNLLVQLDCCEVSKIFLCEKSRLRLNDLFTYAILQNTEEYQCQIHQVVLSAIKAVVGTEDKDNGFKKHLCAYLKRHVFKRDAGLYTFMNLHGEKILALTNNFANDDLLRKMIVLAVIYTVDTYSDQNKYIGIIDGLCLDTERFFLDLCLFIEKKEIEQSKTRNEFGIEDEHYKEKVLIDIDDLKQIHVLDKQAESLICHHIGKWLSSIGKSVDSESLLLRALDLNPKSFHSMSKLAYDYKKQGRLDKMKEMVHAILSPDTFEEVPISILLMGYDLIAQKKYQDLQKVYIDEQLENFAKVIFASLSENYSQTYIVLAKLCNHLSYNKPQFYNELCARLPLPLNIEHDDRLRESYGKIRLAQYRYGSYEQSYREKLFKIVEAYMKDVPRTSDYQRRDMMNLYLSSNNPDKALPIFDEFENKNNSFALQTLSKTYLALGECSKALDAINKAIEHEEDNNDKDYHAAFLHDKARCLKEMGNVEAVNVMKEAISSQTNAKVTKEWSEELNDWMK